MIKYKRGITEKIKTQLYYKDLRINEGEPYTEVREYDFSSYYPEDEFIKECPAPTGSNVYDIRRYGAKPNDMSYDNAKAVSKAFADAGKTGGIVIVDGGEYMTTTVFLQSNTTLFISKGSALVANATGIGFENNSLIYGRNLNNITITGGGKLKCGGNLYGRKPKADKNITNPPPYIDVIKMRRDYRAQLRFAHPSKYGVPIFLYKCKDVRADNFIIENSAYWSFRIQECDTVKITNFVINNNRNVANADGFDIVGGKNIALSHCYISTADDGICMKNAIWLGCQSAMENIEISDCTVISRTNAVKIGTETTHNIKHINIHDCRFMMVDLYPGSVSGISLETCDGTRLWDVNISNITMDRCTCPLFIRLGNRNRAAQISEESAYAVEFGGAQPNRSQNRPYFNISKKTFMHKSEINGINVSNITATGVELPIIITGYKQGRIKKYVKNISLKNFDITYSDKPEVIDKRIFIPEYADVYPESWRFRNLPAYGLWARHVKNLTVENVKISHPHSTIRKMQILSDCINARVNITKK